jgi:hypothetical protein
MLHRDNSKTSLIDVAFYCKDQVASNYENLSAREFETRLQSVIFWSFNGLIRLIRCQ